MSGKHLEHRDPFDAALLKWLRETTTSWMAVELDSLSDADTRAILQLVRAGCIERRGTVEVTMAGFPQRVHARIRLSGDYQRLLTQRVAELIRNVPAWLNEQGRTRAQAHLCFNLNELRLSHHGELAQHDLVTEGSAFVLSLIRGKPPSIPGVTGDGRVVLSDVTVESNTVAAPLADSAVAVAQATAHASVGDIHIHNHIVLPPATNVSAYNEHNESKPPKDEPESNSASKVRRGRPAMDAEAVELRENVLEAWDRARSASVSREQFVADWNETHDRPLTIEDLERYQSWDRIRRRRRT